MIAKTFGLLSLSMGLAALVVWTTGCSSEQPAAAPAADQQGAAAMEHGDHDHAEEMASEEIEQDDDARIKASLASLSTEDRELAMKQKVCPISGDPLGMMGTPIKVDVEGHTVFVCCAGCKDPLLEDANAYLVKLGLKPAAE